jgi:hypothetical protein
VSIPSKKLFIVIFTCGSSKTELSNNCNSALRESNSLNSQVRLSAASWPRPVTKWPI